MVWNSITIQGVNVANVDAVPTFPIGTTMQARDTVSKSVGTFIYLKGVANTAAGDVVEVDTFTPATTRWAGTAGSGKNLAVAMAATIANTFGWYQIGGAATVNTGAGVVAGNPVYWQATAVVDDAQVNGKQMLGATFLTTVVAAGQAVIQINNPVAQGQVV